MVLRVPGITTPEGANFTYYNPAPQGLKLSALREDVSDRALEKRQVFLLLFFRLHLRFDPGPTLTQIRLQNPCWELLYPVLKAAAQRPTGANSGDSTSVVFFFV